MLNKKFKNSNRNYFSCISDYDYYIVDFGYYINTIIDKHRTIQKCEKSKRWNTKCSRKSSKNFKWIWRWVK